MPGLLGRGEDEVEARANSNLLLFPAPSDTMTPHQNSWLPEIGWPGRGTGLELIAS